MLLKSPRGRSKPESTSRAEASETKVATQAFCPWRRQPSYQKTSVINTEEKSLRRCTNQNASFVALLLFAWKLGQK